MKIKKLELENFMIFNSLQTEFSPNINVICGENSTGKTAILKLLYATVQAGAESRNLKGEGTKDQVEQLLVNKYRGVFRPDNDVIGRLVNRRQGSTRANINMFYDGEVVRLGFSNRHEKHIEISGSYRMDQANLSPVYIPPKEIVSATENFGSLYRDYHIAFEETYYDLARLLERPLRKGPNTVQQREVLKSFEEIVDGSITQRDKKFYLRVKGKGEFEMGLVSEGFRKISTIMYLILSGSLSSDAILFWDEPETNMNPKMIRPLVDAILELANMGVQVFVTTHDYFVQQCFNMAAIYQKEMKTKNLEFNFISLYREDEHDEVRCETAHEISELRHNAVMEEFDSLYDREQRYLNGEL